MNAAHAAAASPFRQPKAVWAVAFACVVSFMGIGLVDPILPALAKDLRATPSTVELLFTSYLVITAVAMLITGWVSSRIGAKRTLVIGLTLIVVFSALAGASNGIGGIIGFRAGWGLGNALFIATSLAAIIASASGGFAGAIILYETALGVGIGLGPLVGGELGGISWRGPFFGVTVLMAISLVSILVLLDATPRPSRKISVKEPVTCLRNRGLAIMSFTALCYNWGFFTLLAYTPFPMHLGIHQLGYTFTAWGVLVGIFAVFVAPRLQRRFGTPRVLYVNLAMLGADLVVIAAFTASQTTLIAAVIVSGIFVGLNNTLTTQAVMAVSPFERSLTSATYGFVRFIGGGLAPYVAARLAAHYNVHVPFYLGAAAEVLGIVVLSRGHSLLSVADRGQEEQRVVPVPLAPLSPVVSPQARPVACPAAVAPDVAPDVALEDGHRAPIVVAVESWAGADHLCAVAADLAQALDRPLQILHVVETDIAMDEVVETEQMDSPQVRDTLQALIAQAAARGIPASGYVLEVVGEHGDVGRRIATFANDRHASVIVVGAPSHGRYAELLGSSTTAEVARRAHSDLYIVHPPSPTVADTFSRAGEGP